MGNSQDIELISYIYLKHIQYLTTNFTRQRRKLKWNRITVISIIPPLILLVVFPPCCPPPARLSLHLSLLSDSRRDHNQRGTLSPIAQQCQAWLWLAHTAGFALICKQRKAADRHCSFVFLVNPSILKQKELHGFNIFYSACYRETEKHCDGVNATTPRPLCQPTLSYIIVFHREIMTHNLTNQTKICPQIFAVQPAHTEKAYIPELHSQMWTWIKPQCV